MPARILLVDDGERERELLIAAAEEEGRDLVVVGSKEEAINRMSEEDFDVVVTDLEMDHNPKAGFSVLDAALDNDPSIPVIVITAFGDKDTSVEAMESGAYDYIERNSRGTDTHEMLRSKIKWALKHRELQRRVGTALEDMEFDNEIPEVCVQGDTETSTRVNAWFPEYPSLDASLPVGGWTKLSVNIGSRIAEGLEPVGRGSSVEDAHLLWSLESVDILIVCTSAAVRPFRRRMPMPPGPSANVQFDLSPRRGGVLFLRAIVLNGNDEIHRCDFAFAAHVVPAPANELVLR